MAIRDFRALLSVRLVGQCGDGAFQAALFGAAFFNPDKATSAGAAAAAFTILLLPYSIVGPFAGVVLDRWSRQRILLLANGCRAALVGVVALSLRESGATSTSTLLLALLVVSLSRFVLSGLSAALPRVVEDGALVTANAVTTTLGTGAAAVGGLVCVRLRGPWGSGDAGAARIALLAAASYGLAALLAARMGRHRLGPGDDIEPHGMRRVLQELLSGVRHLRSHAPAARALLAITGQRFFSGLAFVMVLLLSTRAGYVHAGLGGLGQVIGATVTGGLAAAVVTPSAVRRIGAHRWIVGALLTAAAVAAAAFPPYTQVGLLVAGAGIGFTSQAAKICVDTLLQESISDDHRGRVFAIYDMSFNVSFVAAGAAAAVLVPDNGHSLAVVALVSAGYGLTGALYALAHRRRSEAEVREVAA